MDTETRQKTDAKGLATEADEILASHSAVDALRLAERIILGVSAQWHQTHGRQMPTILTTMTSNLAEDAHHLADVVRVAETDPAAVRRVGRIYAQSMASLAMTNAHLDRAERARAVEATQRILILRLMRAEMIPTAPPAATPLPALRPTRAEAAYMPRVVVVGDPTSDDYARSYALDITVRTTLIIPHDTACGASLYGDLDGVLYDARHEHRLAPAPLEVADDDSLADFSRDERGSVVPYSGDIAGITMCSPAGAHELCRLITEAITPRSIGDA
jgi:hypothetical protein